MTPRIRPRIRPPIKLLLPLALAVAAAALFFADVIPGSAMTNTAIIETTFVPKPTIARTTTFCQP